MCPGRTRTTAGNPAGAAPAGEHRPLTRARRGQHPPFSVFPPRPPLTGGASAQLTTRTLTHTDATPPSQAICGTREWEQHGRPGAGADRTVSVSRGAGNVNGQVRVAGDGHKKSPFLGYFCLVFAGTEP